MCHVSPVWQGMDRNERSDKDVQSQTPTARRRKADVWQIMKLTGCSLFLTHTERLHKQTCWPEIAGKAITTRNRGDGGRGDEARAGWKDELHVLLRKKSSFQTSYWKRCCLRPFQNKYKTNFLFPIKLQQHWTTDRMFKHSVQANA